MPKKTECNTEVVSFLFDPIEYYGFNPNLKNMLYVDAVTLCGRHLVSVPALKYGKWMDNYYARID